MRASTSRLEFLGQLAGGLAHEIKNPLSTMKLTLQLLEEEMEEDDSPKGQRARRKIEVLLKEVNHLDDIVQEFLRLARGHDLKFARGNLRELIDELIEFLAGEAERRGVTLRSDCDGDLSSLVFDAGYIRQALMNLLVNAFEAIDAKVAAKGRAQGEQLEVIVRARRRGDLAMIEVIDTGQGVSEADRDRMFRPYFTTKKGGTGMGLPMVRRLIQEHGGQVTFESEPGTGSRFVILMPIDPGKKGALKAMVALGGHGANQA